MLHTGNLDGMSIYEIKEKFPSDFEEFMNDPFHYRIPGGESFEDVVHRFFIFYFLFFIFYFLFRK